MITTFWEKERKTCSSEVELAFVFHLERLEGSKIPRRSSELEYTLAYQRTLHGTLFCSSILQLAAMNRVTLFYNVADVRAISTLQSLSQPVWSNFEMPVAFEPKATARSIQACKLIRNAPEPKLPSLTSMESAEG